MTAPSQSTSDPFQLDRLAEELVNRELATQASQNQESQDLDFPSLVPLSHDNVFLTKPDFQVEEFLLSRASIPLPDLRTELREYLAKLKEELVQLINDDYEAFISLSTDLEGEGDRLARIKLPLSDLKAQILLSRNELQVIQDKIQEKLERRAALREEKALLHLLLKLSESVARLESLLLIAPSENERSGAVEPNIVKVPVYSSGHDEHADDRSHGSRAKHLGRAATEYIQVLYHASKAREEKCVFVDEIQWRIDRIQATISSDLDLVLTAALRASINGSTDIEKIKSNSELTECLRTYDILGLWRDAEDILKKEVVQKFVKKTIYPGALSAPHSPIVPHTPFPPTRTIHLSSAGSLLPRTPYTPFTPFFSAKPNTVGLLPTSPTSPHTHLLENADEPLAGLYNQALRFVERDLSRIMNIAEAVSLKSLSGPNNWKEANTETISGGKGFEILANVIWEEFGTAIMNELGGIIFASGRPSEFRKHHELSQAFLRSLEYFAPSSRSVEAMRAHPVYTAFERRWQLPVYFQIRWKEIVGPLESSLADAQVEPNFSGGLVYALHVVSPQLTPAHPAKNTFVTPQANAVWVAITACWSAEIFIPELCHRFWRLTLQILSRYNVWLGQFLPRPAGVPKPIATGAMEQQSTVSPSQSRSSTPVMAPEPLVEVSVAEDSVLRRNAALIIDVKAMRSNVLSIWREEISMMLPETSVGEGLDGATAQEALHRSLANLTSLNPILSSEIVSTLTKRCCDALLPVRSIPSQFRAMSNKRIPTEPSYFVSSILRPVKYFFGIEMSGGPGQLLSDEYLRSYSFEVFDNVSQRYIFYLSAMKKTEESLRRLKKGKKTTFSLFGNTGAAKDDDSKDEERIRTQMALDVRAFGTDGESLGVVLNDVESYKALKEMVETQGMPSN